MASSPLATIQIDHGIWPGDSRIGGADRLRTRVVFSKPASAADPVEPHPSSESPTAKAKQTKILQRWPSHQAREPSATNDRHNYEAELSVLSTLEPVSARAASLLRETSPPPGGGSGGGGGAGGGGAGVGAGAGDLPRNVRASSLIQMWREMEAEGGLMPSNRFACVEEQPESFEVCDDSGWESDLTPHSSPPESERGQSGGAVLRRMGSRIEHAAARHPSHIDQNRKHHQQQQQQQQHHVERLNSGVLDGAHPRIRGRQEMQQLLERFAQDRRQELERLAEQHPVSGFPHQRRIQTFLRFRSMRREVAVQDHQRPQSTAKELDQLQRGIAILFLRQRFSPGLQQDCTAVPAFENKGSIHMQPSDISIGPEYSDLAGLQSRTALQETATTERDLDNIQPEEDSLPSGSEDLQEGSQNSDVAWEEGSLHLSNHDWNRPMDSSNPHSVQDEVLMDEPELDNVQQVREAADGMWLTSASPSQRAWERREEMYNDLLETYSDNAELRELLERRTVSTSLASEFRDRLDRLVLTLHRRQLAEEGFGEDEEEQALQRHYHEFDDGDLVPSSSSLMHLQSQTLDHSCSLQCSAFDHHSSHHFHERDLVLDMRSDIAQIHHEVGELRRLLETCMETQEKFQCSITQEVTTVVRHSVGTGDTSNSSKWESIKRGSCCICHEKQIDSLLYRCGHMCTCYNCAHDLQWNSGQCPICRASIVDVVRAYCHS